MASVQPRQQTRKQRRELAREQRRALERAQADLRARRKRLRQLASVLGVVVVGIVVIAIASSSGGVKRIAPRSAEARQAANAVSTLLAGIPQQGNALGTPTAPVTLQYFGDLQCPVCRSFTQSALPALIGRWIRPGAVRIEYRSLQTATREPEVFEAQQLAALAAGRQGKLWNFVETFYAEQLQEGTGYVTPRFISGIAEQVRGLSLGAWSAARGDPQLADQLNADAQVANGQGLEGTPAFLIGRTGGAMSRLEPASFTDAGAFNGAIEKLTRGAPAG
ncbi:MAG TPA: thioredoxin domain-containing protein [Solirubrobacteraceae bacterium]|jgi:protein-disulfide isomerase